jgi:hypothetical protein
MHELKLVAVVVGAYLDALELAGDHSALAVAVFHPFHLDDDVECWIALHDFIVLST